MPNETYDRLDRIGLTYFWGKLKQLLAGKAGTSTATQSANGLMSSADKTKLDGIANGATANVGTITGITMNGSSMGTSGNVNLGTVLTAHQDISGKVNGPASATNNRVATFDGTTGKVIKDSGYTIEKSVPANALFTDTTYSQISRGSGAGLAPGLPSGSGTAKYLREDGSWETPPNTTYTFTDNNPTLAWSTTSKVATVGGVDIHVTMPGNPNTWRGIQDNLTSSTNTTESLSAKQGYLLANGSARDSTKVPLSGGTMTGKLIVPSEFEVQAQNSTNEGGEIILKASSSSYYDIHIDQYQNYFRLYSNTTERFKVDMTTGSIVVGTIPWNSVTGKPSSFYTLPLAASGTRGGIQIGYSESGKKYAVKLDSEKAYVEVPWTDESGNNRVLRAGDTMTGNLKVNTTSGDAWIGVRDPTATVYTYLYSEVSGKHGVWSPGYYNGSAYVSNSKWMIIRGTDGVVTVNGKASDNVLKSGDTMTGRLYVNRGTQNAASFVSSKSGTHWTGIGYGGRGNETLFSPCDSDGTWQAGAKTDTFCFNGNVIPNQSNVFNLGNASYTWKSLYLEGSVKQSSAFYPIVQSKTRSSWYKITFPYAGNTEASRWFMVSFDLHVGGAYSNNPSGVIHIAYYYYNNSSGAVIKGQISGMAVGVLMNYVKVFYNLSTERGILYVKNARNQYNTIWIDNLTAHDTAPNYDFTQTTIEAISAIDESQYEIIPVSTLYNDGTTNMYYYNGTTSRTLLHSGNYTDYAVARTGDTMTDKLTLQKSSEVYLEAKNTGTGISVLLDTGAGGNHGIYTRGYYNGSTFTSDPKWMIYRGTDGRTYVDGMTWQSITPTAKSGYVFTNDTSYANVYEIAISGYFSATGGNLISKITSATVIGQLPSGVTPKNMISVIVGVSDGSSYVGTAFITIRTSGEIVVSAMSTNGHIMLRLPLIPRA